MSPKATDARKGDILRAIYDKLFSTFGPQHWWPAKTPFEVCVGAILVQNTNWQNVTRAIENLHREGLLEFPFLQRISRERMKTLIRPAGYFNVKATRLKNFLDFLAQNYEGDLKGLSGKPWPLARAELLSVNGIGHETADSILLYALNKPVFVVDAYTKRLLLRHGFIEEAQDYTSMQKFFMTHIHSDPVVYNEYHALIVQWGKRVRYDAREGKEYLLRDRKYFL
ncbi:MAG: endonuclease III domain-containing protein [Candidatus Omnitrophica bacterium]|nr:endonuclease III domain-containing protein [Candidatus Omnitrophota bacterium]